MAAQSPPISTSTARYHDFQQQRPAEARRDREEGFDRTLLAEDGTVLYLDDWGALFREIVKYNDVPLLKKYLAKFNPLLLMEPDHRDPPFWIAAAYGNIDTFRLLLEYCNIRHPPKIETLYEQGQIVLNCACRGGRVEMVRFLLNNQPPFGDLQGKEPNNTTCLLQAAQSFTCWTFISNDNERLARRDYLAQCEELMQFLLDRGACARDETAAFTLNPNPQPLQPRDTVLSLAIAKASPGLIKRLINEGADVHGKKMHLFCNHSFDRDSPIWDVTTLHIGSLYWNTEGIQALFDGRDNDIDVADMVLCRDTSERLPLHWAAQGPHLFERENMFYKDDIVLHATSTLKLLLASNPGTINAQDNCGETALHCVIQSFKFCNDKCSDIVEFLCQNGADASLRNKNGQNPLYYVVHHADKSKPIDIASIMSLLTHGANINDTDIDGNSVLHFAARNLMHIEMVKFLISQGANINTKNSKGNTPLHEAAGGAIYSYEKDRTLEDEKRVQDEMIKVLQEAGDVNMMDEANVEGKTPRQIRDEKRKEWWGWYEEQRQRRAGLWKSGIGRGRKLDV
ncbi:hypothetical protein B7463_g2999, partial [Scytalidium lignicola]